MRMLKQYEHLKGVYMQCLRKSIISSIIFTFLTMLSFGLYFLADLFALVFVFMFVADLGFWMICFARSVDSKLMLKKFTDAELKRINDAIPNAEKILSFIYTGDALIISEKKIFLIPVRDILWVYGNHVHTVYKTLGSVSGKSDNYTVYIVDKHKHTHTHTVAMKYGLTNVLEFLKRNLSQYREGIFWGYSDELVNAFRKDFKGMLAASEVADAEMHLEQRERGESK